MQTSSASRTYTPFFVVWIKKPVHVIQSLQSLAQSASTVVQTTLQNAAHTVSSTADSYFTTLLVSAQKKLYETLSDCPSYFPNINSTDMHDFHPPGPLMTQQFDQFMVSNSSRTYQISIPHTYYLQR